MPQEQERSKPDQEFWRAKQREANAKAKNPEGVPAEDKGHDPAKGN